MIEADLLAAYMATHYRVFREDATIVLRIDQPSVELAHLHATTGVISSAFITAWNPFSRLSDFLGNEAAQEQLQRELQALGFRILPGEGADPDGRWPAEPSVLALGIDYDQACRLGSRFRQNAILYAGEDAVPRLVTL